jgi:hypothetical protein
VGRTRRRLSVRESREAPPPASVASVFGTRRTITLATGPLRKMLPIDDEPDEEDCEPV